MERLEAGKDLSRRELITIMATSDGTAETFGPGAIGSEIGKVPSSWDLEADVVVIGSGAAGLPAAIRAVEGGASVIVVEANYDVGGHAIISGGNVPLGGGTSAQKKYGIMDSPDLVFADLTDWTVVQANGWPDFRYNDRQVMRAFADNCARTFEFLLENGVKFKSSTWATVRRSDTDSLDCSGRYLDKPLPYRILHHCDCDDHAEVHQPQHPDARAAQRLHEQRPMRRMGGPLAILRPSLCPRASIPRRSVRRSAPRSRTLRR